MSEHFAENGQVPEAASDELVVARVLAGDTQAFELLVLRHQDAVARIVGGKVPGQEVAEVAHTVFIRAFQSLPGYSPVAPFRRWLATLAVRACYDYWREQYRSRETPLAALSEAQRAWLLGRGTEREAGRGVEDWDLLEWALNHLKPADRMALVLVHVEGRGVAEAGALLGWSTANVKVRCFRARAKLRRLIGEELAKAGGGA